MGELGDPVVRVVGRKQPDFVPLPDELLGKRLDVATDAPRVRVRVRGDECYSHWGIVAESPDPKQGGAPEPPMASPTHTPSRTGAPGSRARRSPAPSRSTARRSRWQ